MAGVDVDDARAAAGQLTSGWQPDAIEGLLFRSALLAGYGPRAPHLSAALSRALEAGTGRSCLEAGAPVQLTVDAPGPAGLRVGLRVSDHPSRHRLSGLVPAAALDHVWPILARLPASSHASLGTWVFRTDQRQSIFVDLRDPNPADAHARLAAAIPAHQCRRLDIQQRRMPACRPWALRLEANAGGLTRVQVHWLLDRHATPSSLVIPFGVRAWEETRRVLSHLLRRPDASGRWVLVTSLTEDDEPVVRVGNSGWTLVPEDEAKHRAVGALFAALGGSRDFAEALWSLCRNAARPGWRVGRACEVRVGLADGTVRARLFLAPILRV